MKSRSKTNGDTPTAAIQGTEELIAGRYRVEAVLGEGGMGAVYRARDEQLGVAVALKRLHAGSERAKVALFEQEFFTLAELAHPRIIEVYDYGVDAGRAHYTMELLDGADLRDHKNLEWQTVCAVLCDVACSLGILHSRGLLHRDVSPRNVRRTADGRAKLIDFGAMARIGSSKELVGTPPCVAPEVLHGQPSDGRADLFALGVVGYWLLTGRYAYPARSFAELPDIWSSPAVPIQQLAPGVPARLGELIGELISLDPHGRPRTAGEVVERLSAIGGFELADAETFAGAYLMSPKLVGREALISWSRASLREVFEGRGKVLMVEGDVGTGLTRALSTCAAEAKRQGAVVITASAADAASGEYGIVKALARHLARAMPGAESLLGIRERALLQHLLSDAVRPPDAPPPERRHVQVALRDWLADVAGHRRLVIVVDDVDAADEPSLSLLALLAERLKKLGVAIVMARHRGAGSGLPLEVLSRLAETFHVEPLSAAENEELVRSVFGDVGNVMQVAETVHERARGNPRDVMAYLAHLVERGAARYERAAWVLSNALDGTDLPSSIGAVLEAKFRGLDPDAQELARALALTDPSWLGVQEYGILVGFSGARVFKALATLVSSRILVEDGSGHCFVGRVPPEWLRSGDAPWVASIHASLAELAASRGEPFRRLHHLLESGQAAVAIEEMVNQLGTERLDYTADTVDLIERALAATQGQRIPALQLMELRLRLVGVSAMTGDLATFRRHAPGEMARLRKDSGLDDWEALAPDLSPGERLQLALSRTHERYAATPEFERGFAPFEAIKRLARLCAGFAAMAGAASDRSILDAVPPLAPLGMLSPAIALIEESTTAMRLLESGRVVKARAAFAELLERLASTEGLEPAHREQMLYGWMYVAGSIDATYGLSSCLAFAAELDKVPKYRSGAWHMRRSYYRMLGSFEKARGCQRQMELLELRDGPQTFKSANFRIELVSSAMSDDVVGLKSLAVAVDAAAVRLPRLRALAQMSRAHFHRIRGEYELGLESLAPVLEFAEPNGSIDWVPIAASHVELLALSGRVEDALTYAQRYRSASRQEEHSGAELEAAWALALAAAGRVDEAEVECDRIIQNEELRGTRGLRVARCYQARARIALARGDNDAFTLWAKRFAEFCSSTESSALRAQANRLMQDGRRAGVGDLRDIELPVTRMEGPDHVGTMATRLSSCATRSERARLALSLAMETFGAEGGHLFGVQGNSLERLVSFPDPTVPEALTADLEALVAGERDEQDETQYSEIAPGHVDQSNQAPKKSGAYRIRPLYSDAQGGLALVGALALSEERENTGFTTSRSAAVPARTLRTIADALAQSGDVDRITCVS